MIMFSNKKSASMAKYKYVRTINGREKNRLAQRKYYYKTTCNNKYHDVYNPNGNRIPKKKILSL